MPFFPQAYQSNEGALFQLLSELDQQQQKQAQQLQSHPCIRRIHRPQTFTPRFDVAETNEAYELYGEVPGLEHSDINIEFSDAQTLIIKGKTERRLNIHGAAVAPEAKQATSTHADAETPSSKSTHGATVEDDYDEADTPLVTPASTASPSAAEKGKHLGSAAPVTNAVTETETVTPARYWVAERKVGEFARSFAFEQRIEQDFVTAGLKNGVLRVVVPKSLKSKRVAVSVL